MTADFINRVFVLTGLSKKDFAKRVDVSDSTLRNWLNGKSNPQFYNQKIIRAAFREETRQVNETPIELD